MSRHYYNRRRLAEIHGSERASRAVEGLFKATNQAEALRALHEALDDALNPFSDKALRAVAGGFAVRLVNILERGRDAIRADGVAENE